MQYKLLEKKRKTLQLCNHTVIKLQYISHTVRKVGSFNVTVLCVPTHLSGVFSSDELFLLTVILLQELHSGEQHSFVLGISDVQLLQVLLFQQLERIQVLVAIEQESWHVLLCDTNTMSEFYISF